MRAWISLPLIFLIVLCLWILNAYSLDRCLEFKTDIRIQYTKYFGSGYPFHYAMGKIQQESNCRPNVTAFDGGKGVSQFMPATELYIEGLMNEGNLNMYNPEHAIKAQAFYMKQLHKQNKQGNLWIDEMFYNSGAGTTKKEATRAGSWDYEEMKSVCKRKVLKLKSGKLLDLCSVGYDYPVRIFKYGNLYREHGDGEWKYW